MINPSYIYPYQENSQFELRKNYIFKKKFENLDWSKKVPEFKHMKYFHTWKLKYQYIRNTRIFKMFEQLNSEIEEARKKILTLDDNWDGEGSKGYNTETFNRSSKFLLNLFQNIYDRYEIVIEVPKILPGPDGSIDIHWRTKDFELLVNIPENSNEPASYYGDNYSNSSTEGASLLENLNEMIIPFLRTFF
ncbi:MAG: hypothetical protein ACTSVY_09215 [Candidatus Helarchaeota archaeon]